MVEETRPVKKPIELRGVHQKLGRKLSRFDRERQRERSEGVAINHVDLRVREKSGLKLGKLKVTEIEIELRIAEKRGQNEIDLRTTGERGWDLGRPGVVGLLIDLRATEKNVNQLGRQQE
jgi:hypothetical protein